MKNAIFLMMLVTSITATAFAQNNPTKSDKTFDLPTSHASRRFTFDLGKGNKMQIELSNMEDLNRFADLDSVIRVFLSDIEPLKDSLGDGLLSRRIDYVTDSLGRKKIRIQLFEPKGSSFLVRDGDLSALKLEQDTIHFLGTVSFIAKYTTRRAFTAFRNYRLSFFLNDLTDLTTYTDGSLNKKIQAIKNTIRSAWNTTNKQGASYLKADPTITAKRPRGFVAGSDYLNFRISTNIQNYKHYFVPSFSLGTGIIISNSYFKRDISLSWEPHFFFARDDNGKLKTFRNDMLELNWGQGLIKDNDPRKESHFVFQMSLGYLIKREGDYFEKNTLRLGAGRLSMFGGKTKLDPVMYFNHFFKGVTPGLRLIQSF